MTSARSVLLLVALVAFAFLLAPGASAQDAPRLALEVEAGPVWQSRNDVRIPNDPSATRFSLRDLAGSGPWPTGRVYLTWNIGGRHGLRAMVAPFSITETGVLAGAVNFAGATYQTGTPVEGTYKFNSYRLSYRYRFHDGARWTWWVGFTAKIRDANIALRQGSTTSRKTDLGFVPLLHLSANSRFGTRWRLILDMDALAGGPGRAEDVAVKMGYDVARRWTLAAGYRTVEGGADVSSVYTFAWLHYGVLSVTHRF
jgi:hypothetical protein